MNEGNRKTYLVSARDEAGRVVDAGVLVDHHRLSVRVPVVIEVGLDAGHGVLVDVDRGKVPINLDEGFERGEPSLVELLAHGRRAEETSFRLERADELVPEKSTGDHGQVGRSTSRSAIGLLEST